MKQLGMGIPRKQQKWLCPDSPGSLPSRRNY